MKYPGPLVRVEWADIVGESGWCDDTSRTTPILCHTVGWRLPAPKGVVIVVDTVTEDGTGGRTVLPRGCVKRIVRLDQPRPAAEKA